MNKRGLRLIWVDLQRPPMTTNDYQWLPMTIWWLSADYPMTIQWLSADYPMTIRWLSNDYPMTIQWLSNDYHELLITFFMFIDLKRSIDRRWLFKSGATFLLRWSCLLLNLNGWICQTFVSRHHPLTPCGGLPHLARHKKVTKMIEGRRSTAIGTPCNREYCSFETSKKNVSYKKKCWITSD